MQNISFNPQLTPEFVLRSLHLTMPYLPDPTLPFTCVTTDSRKIPPGCLFVALKGEKFDGHSFIEGAIASGARGVIFKRGFPLPPTKGISLFPVEDPLRAYRRLATHWRNEFSIPIIAVAGSAGKTTTKEFLAALLAGKWPKVLKTQGSQNGFVGIPMTLLELRNEHSAAVIEVGIDEIGAMEQHMSILSPTLAVLTAIGPEHLEKLQDVPTVAREEGIALSYVTKEGGTVCINLDDPWIKPHLTTYQAGGRKIPFSLEGVKAPVEMISGQISSDGKQLTFQGLGIKSTTVPLPLLGKHNASNLLAAISVAVSLGLSAEEIQNGLRTFKGAEGRSEIHEIVGGTSIICDYYNAQPASVRAGLELLSQVASRPGKTGTRWACLADMLELGPQEEQFHRGLADQLLELKIENVLLMGPKMNSLLDELEKKKFKGYLSHFVDHSELSHHLSRQIKAGDTVLIKGSRGMKMEEIWKILEPQIKGRWSTPVESENSPTHT